MAHVASVSHPHQTHHFADFLHWVAAKFHTRTETAPNGMRRAGDYGAPARPSMITICHGGRPVR